ncbi:hypothetical protein UlMin_010178 [Ulmus minor]
MGTTPSKHKRRSFRICEKDAKGLQEKIRFIQEGMSIDSVYEREKEREMMVFAFKKAEWKQEKKKLREEVKILRTLVEEKEAKIREMEEGMVGEKGSGEKEWAALGADFLVKQISEERARRDETIEKWKQLYLAIKVELDDLIKRTHEDGLYWRAEEEDMAEELKKELQAKDETIRELKSKLASMDQERYKRDREVDILRQSLRIMTSKKVLQTKTTNRMFVKHQPKKL